MNTNAKTFLPLLSVLILSSVSTRGYSEDEKVNPHEAAFSAMLANATLSGSWAPIADGEQGEEKGDGYKIISATKKKGDIWTILSKVEVNGVEIEFPMPVTVKFAGDVAVLILDGVPTANGGTYSARVMFHNDVYAGSWWGTDEKGTISGTITRAK